MPGLIEICPIICVIGLAVALARTRARLATLESQIQTLKELPKQQPPAAPAADRPRQAKPRRRADAAESGFPAGPRLISVPRLAQPPARRETRRRAAADAMASRYGPLWEMAAAGQTQADIARTTGIPIGQVELILGLRDRPADRKMTRTRLEPSPDG